MINPMKLMTALVLALAFQDKAELRWKWTKGQEMVYKYSQKTLFEVVGQPIEQEMGFTFLMTVTDVADSGEAAFLMKFQGVVAKGISPQGEFDYDSEKDKEVPEGPAAMQARIVGQTFTMKMSPVGKITAIEGWDKVLEEMLKAAPNDNPQARLQAKEMFGNDAFRGLIQQAFSVFPENKVGKDDTWSSDYVVKAPMIGPMTYTQKSKVTEIKDGDVRFEQELKLELKEGEKAGPLAGVAEIRDARGKAVSVFSTAKSCLVTQKAAMEMTISVRGSDMPMRQVVEMKLVPKK